MPDESDLPEYRAPREHWTNTVEDNGLTYVAMLDEDGNPVIGVHYTKRVPSKSAVKRFQAQCAAAGRAYREENKGFWSNWWDTGEF